jgi:hypothetical protein
MKPETLRTYAAIFSMPYRGHDGRMYPATSVALAMAQCAIIVAEAIERDDPNLPPGWRDVTEESHCGLAATSQSEKCAAT